MVDINIVDEDLSSRLHEDETTRNTVPDLPKRSRKLYEKCYNAFVMWCKEKSVVTYSENVLITYLTEKSKHFKSSTLWSTYSMLKPTLLIKHNINISTYSKLIAFIKQQNLNYKPTKSNIFSRQEMIKFLISAPDDKYLMWKVCFIFGVEGACRMDELKKMSIDDVQDKEDVLVVTIPDSKPGKRRIFTITNNMAENINPIEIYRKYRVLRPLHVPHKSLFIYYKAGKCSVQPVGIHTFGKIPSELAKYLKLPNPKTYTGHSFRRTSASLTGNLKQHWVWKSSRAAEGYVESSISRTNEIDSRKLSVDYNVVPMKFESLSEPSSPLTIEETQIYVAGTPMLPKTDETKELSIDELNRLVLLEELQVLRLKKGKLLRDLQR